MARNKNKKAKDRSSFNKLKKDSSGWIKNAGKSAGWSASQALLEVNPIIKENSSYVLSHGKEQIDKLKKVDKTNTSISRKFKNVSKEAIKNIKDSVATGDFNSKERASKADKKLKEALGMSIDDDTSDFEDLSVDNIIESSEELDSDQFDIDFKNMTVNSKTTIIKSNSNKSVGELSSSLANIATSMIEVTSTGFSTVIDSVNNLHETQSTFFEGSLNLFNDMNSLLTDIQKYSYSSSMTDSGKSTTLSNILEGTFNIGDMVDYISEMKDKSDGKGMFSKLSKTLANPLQSAMTFGFTKALGPILEKTPLKGIDKSFGDLPVTLYNALDGDLEQSAVFKNVKGKYEKLNKDGFIRKNLDKAIFNQKDEFGQNKYTDATDAIRSTLMDKIFGGQLKTKRSISSSIDPNAKMSFDAQTHNSINVVIPGYLGKILSSLSGQEEVVYNFSDGKWKTSSKARKTADSSLKNKLLNNNRISSVFDEYKDKFEGDLGSIVKDLVSNDVRNKDDLKSIGTISDKDKSIIDKMFSEGNNRFFGGNKLLNALTSGRSTMSDYNTNFASRLGNEVNAFNGESITPESTYSYQLPELDMVNNGKEFNSINDNLNQIYSILVNSLTGNDSSSSLTSSSVSKVKNDKDNQTPLDKIDKINEVKDIIENNKSIDKVTSKIKSKVKGLDASGISVGDLDYKKVLKGGLLGSLGLAGAGIKGITKLGFKGAKSTGKLGLKGLGKATDKTRDKLLGKINNLEDSIFGLSKKIDKNGDISSAIKRAAPSLLNKIPSKALKMGALGAGVAGIGGLLGAGAKKLFSGSKVSADSVTPDGSGSGSSLIKNVTSTITNDVNSTVMSNPVFKNFMKDPSGTASQVFALSPAGTAIAMKNNGMDPNEPSHLITNTIKGFFNGIKKKLSSGTSSGGSSGGSSSSGSSGGAKNANTGSGSVEEQVWNGLTSLGWSKEQTAGIMGNMQHESNFIPNVVEGGARSDDPSGLATQQSGYGLVQWTPGNKLLGIIQEAGIKGKPGEVKTQVEALNYQMTKGTEIQAGNALKGANSPESAAEIFARYYERPAEWALAATLAGRQSAARDYYNKFKDNKKSSASTSSKDKSSSKGSSSSASSSSSSGSSGKKGSSATSTGQGKANGDKWVNIAEGDLGSVIGNGQCYAFTSAYATQVDPKNIPAGLTTGNAIKGGIAAADIGEDYSWDKWGWTVVRNPKFEDVRPGDIINYKRGARTYTTDTYYMWDGTYGHTGVVGKVYGDGTFDFYGQNPGAVAKLRIKGNTDFGASSVIHPPGSVGGGSSSSSDGGGSSASSSSDYEEETKDASYTTLSDEEYKAMVKRISGKYDKALNGNGSKSGNKGDSSSSSSGGSSNGGNNNGSDSSSANPGGNDNNNGGNNGSNNGGNNNSGNNNGGNNNGGDDNSNAKPNPGNDYDLKTLQTLRDILSRVTDIKNYTDKSLERIVDILNALKESVKGVEVNNDLIKETNSLIKDLTITIDNSGSNGGSDDNNGQKPIIPGQTLGFNLDRNMMNPVLGGN